MATSKLLPRLESVSIKVSSISHLSGTCLLANLCFGADGI